MPIGGIVNGEVNVNNAHACSNATAILIILRGPCRLQDRTCYSRGMNSMQTRAARGLLRWTQGDLCREAGVSLPTVVNFEAEKTTPIPATLAMIKQAFDMGITQQWHSASSKAARDRVSSICHCTDQ